MVELLPFRKQKYLKGHLFQIKQKDIQEHSSLFLYGVVLYNFLKFMQHLL